MDAFATEVIPIQIEDEMKNSYMDYSMSVIIGRALPDVRDGLKPVHRRILYAMHQMGLTSGKRYSKCAGTVGEVLKKFHPHGDGAVYDALVRMAQPWNLRYMLVDGQGNFGSVDGDKAAAYRYTEARMTRLASELMMDISKDTVDYVPNFDGTVQEPVVFPTRFPNMLVNGADGIAVGMATKIPPHNLQEVVDGCLAVIDNPEIGVAGLMEIIPGPDFPTAGTIYGKQGILDAYSTGRGKVIIRGNTFIEELKNGREAIIIDELPYQVNKSRLVVQIADLVRSKSLEGVFALRDESDRDGMRVVVELKTDAFPEVVLNHLFKHTPLQSTFGTIMLAIVDSQPRVLTLKEMLKLFIGHRRTVVLRRTRYDLARAEERAHILEGFKRALDMLDEVIALIRANKSPATARLALQTTFDFSEAQAAAILDMKLQRLTGMEQQKIVDELEALHIAIAEYEEILGSETRLMAVVREELVDVRDRYGDARRTKIIEAYSALNARDLTPKEDQVLTISTIGYVKRCDIDEWRVQSKGGKGSKGIEVKEGDIPSTLLIANTHDTLLVFTQTGRVLPLDVFKIPQTSRTGKGRPMVNFVQLKPGESISSVLPVESLDNERMLFFVTASGFVKLAPYSHYGNLRPGGLIATTIRDDDSLVTVLAIDANTPMDAMLFTRDGKCIRFPIAQAPVPNGRSAMGNRGIKLAPGDVVVDCVIAPSSKIVDNDDDLMDDETSEEPIDSVEGEEPWETTLLTVTEKGLGKRTPFKEYRAQNRNGKGLMSIKINEKSGKVIAVLEVKQSDEIMAATNAGQVIRINAGTIRLVKSRGSRGVILKRCKEGEFIVDITRLAQDIDTKLDAEVSSEIEGAAPGTATNPETSNETE
jgi:DNA gyrase subunit A